MQNSVAASENVKEKNSDSFKICYNTSYTVSIKDDLDLKPEPKPNYNGRFKTAIKPSGQYIS